MCVLLMLPILNARNVGRIPVLR